MYNEGNATHVTTVYAVDLRSMQEQDVTTSVYGPAPNELDKTSQAVLIVLYSLTTFLSVIGNIIVIVVFWSGKRSSDLKILLMNLAAADLIMAVFCLPFTFTMVMLDTWVFSAPMCPIVLYMQTVSVTVSVATNMAIGIDRFWVVTYPMKSRGTKNRNKRAILIIWILAFGLSSIQLVIGRTVDTPYAAGVYRSICDEVWWEPQETMRRTYTFFILLLTYIMPLIILALTYGHVATKLWQRKAPGEANEARDSQQLRSKRKVIKMLVVVVCLFAVCWLPLHVFFLVTDLAPWLLADAGPKEFKIFIILYYTVHWFAMSNCFVNPIIYGFLNDSFRLDLVRLLGQCCPCCRKIRCMRANTPIESHTAISQTNRSTRCDNATRYHNYPNTSQTSLDSTKRLINVRMNGVGRYDCEVDGLLKPQAKTDNMQLSTRLSDHQL